jgi:DNA (cytosine-5)-methyltransferase 1
MSKRYTGISLFTGAGGMDVGFHAAGVDVILANELVPAAAETYRANWPSTVVINDDVNNIFPALDAIDEVDFVFGGPPCQGFSVAGKMDPHDDRSKLIFTFLEVVEKVRPQAFVMENVKALATLSKWSEVRKRYFKECERLGYVCAPFVLNATDYGVPQKRERVFLFVFGGIFGRNNSSVNFNIALLNHSDSSFATQFVQESKKEKIFKIDNTVKNMDDLKSIYGQNTLKEMRYTTLHVLIVQ